MTVFRCGRFPDGEAPIRTVAGIVLFQDGSATVDDPELAAALREVPAVFEISEDVEEAGAAAHGTASSTSPGKRPRKNASETVWRAWAVQNGMDRETATDLTKAQLIELADQLDKE